MVTDKEIKKTFKLEASKNPEKYYATKVLKGFGYERKQCKNCGTFFWTVNKGQDHCGDSSCSGGFTLFKNNPSKKKLSYIDVWVEFSKMFKTFGYTPIKRYPVVARWNDTMDFTIASIAAFQPYVVSGEVEPPANPLVIPQFSIRFSDIENIGITASHNTGFVMIGQHMFVSPDRWDQDKVFKDIVTWLTEGLGLPYSEITFHEDAWAGGGNFGPCMEYFSRGVELGNQVYMLFEQGENGPKELPIKVLDMGMGMERNAWFTQATSTQHEAVYPTVVKALLKRTNLEIDHDLMKRFIPYSGMLNLDEVDDINKAWKRVADLVGVSVEELKSKVLPLSNIFAIADHMRTLLFALNDGALPSNVGGGYNLRVLVRRCLSFIDKHGWDISLPDVCRWHAEYLKPIFPELSEHLDEIEQILDVEKKKYEATKQKTQSIVERLITDNVEVTEEKLIELYDSNGIPPQLIIDEAEKLGKKIVRPDNFFGKVAERHERLEQEHATKKAELIDIGDAKDTEALYFFDYKKIEFEAKVLKIKDSYVVLDKTAFYPTSGGQVHDIGELGGMEVVDVFKQGSAIIHKLSSVPGFKEGDSVKGKIDFERRKQLAQHHTATHIVNAAARKVLGRHVNQAGAKKTEEKAHLDITHFESLADEELKRIEEEANLIVNSDLKINSEFIPRNTAEKRYGMSIYQGGAVPGKMIRIIEIHGTDVEACGGTHLNRTSETGEIRMIKSTKIQDGIIRLTFTAGKAKEKIDSEASGQLSEVAELLGVDEDVVPSRAQELFETWKKARKAVKKKKKIDLSELDLSSTQSFDGQDALSRTAEILQTQPEHVAKTVKRFMDELEGFKEEISKL